MGMNYEDFKTFDKSHKEEDRRESIFYCGYDKFAEILDSIKKSGKNINYSDFIDNELIKGVENLCVKHYKDGSVSMTYETSDGKRLFKNF